MGEMMVCVCAWDEADHALWMEDGKAAAAVAMQVLETQGVVCPNCSGMPSPMLQSMLDAARIADEDSNMEEVCEGAACKYIEESGKTFRICAAKYDDDGMPKFVNLSTAFHLTDCGSCEGLARVNSRASCKGPGCWVKLCGGCATMGVDLCRDCDSTEPCPFIWRDDKEYCHQIIEPLCWDNTMIDLTDVGGDLFSHRRCFKEDSVVACVMAGSDGDVEAWWTKRISDSDNKWEYHTPTPVKCAHPPVKRRRV